MTEPTDESAALRADTLQEDETRGRCRKLFRYAELGRCVNAVTHDINNHLGVIMAYTELVMLEENLGEEPRRMLNDIIDGVTRCSRLINGLTAVARKEKPAIGIIDIGNLLRLILDLRDYAFKTERITLEAEIGEGLASIAADVPKLQLAVTYLLFNAQEALEGAPAPKRIRVTVQNQEGGIAIGVWNSGAAIPPEVAQRMFEPFITTKPAPHVGLGLAAVREIAELHRGTISYDEDRGFTMSLPFENGLSETF